MGNALTGHVILIVDPRVGRFVLDLQAALERRGAETLIVHEPVRAFERIREFRFSAGVLSYDHASDALCALIGDLSHLAILLYGDENAAAASARKVPHLPFAQPDVTSIVGALARLLEPARS